MISFAVDNAIVCWLFDPTVDKSLIHGKRRTASLAIASFRPLQMYPIGWPFIPHVLPWRQFLSPHSKTSQTDKIKILRTA